MQEGPPAYTTSREMTSDTMSNWTTDWLMLRICSRTAKQGGNSSRDVRVHRQVWIRPDGLKKVRADFQQVIRDLMLLKRRLMPQNVSLCSVELQPVVPHQCTQTHGSEAVQCQPDDRSQISACHQRRNAATTPAFQLDLAGLLYM